MSCRLNAGFELFGHGHGYLATLTKSRNCDQILEYCLLLSSLNCRKTSLSATMDAMEKRERGVNAPRSQFVLHYVVLPKDKSRCVYIVVNFINVL